MIEEEVKCRCKNLRSVVDPSVAKLNGGERNELK